MSPTISDSEVVHRVLAGQRDEYAVLVRRYRGPLRGFLNGRFGLSGADLDDAMQEAFVAAYRGLARLRDPGAFAGFLMRIASRNVPARKTTGASADRAEAPSTERHEQEAVLQEAIARLPEGMQVVLALKYGDGLTAGEIADRLAQTCGTVTKTLSRAYKRLQEDPALARFRLQRTQR